jgi:hypothetical protein
VLDLVQVAGRDRQDPGELDLAEPALLAQPTQPRTCVELVHALTVGDL